MNKGNVVGNIIWAMHVRVTHNTTHGGIPMSECGPRCRDADVIITRDHELKGDR